MIVDKLILFRGLKAAWAGDELSLEVTPALLKLVHHEAEIGQPMAWVYEIPCSDVLDVDVRPEGGSSLLMGNLRGAAAERMNGELTLLMPPVCAGRLPRALILTGLLHRLQPLANEIRERTAKSRETPSLDRALQAMSPMRPAPSAIR